MPTTTFALRPARADDAALLRSLSDEARRPELAGSGLPRHEIDALLAHEFEARRRHHEGVHPTAVDQVIEVDGVAVGRILVDEGPRDLRVVDVVVTRRARGRGAATRALQHWIAVADERGLTTTLHVALGNPAVRLYERLGFDHLGLDWGGLLMRRPVRRAR